MKYIDTDKLIKSVNNYQEGAKAALNPTDGDADYYQGKIDACKDIQEFITSRQQEIWKPSEEQMEALKEAAENSFYAGEGATLRTLYNDLQKRYGTC